MNIMRRILLKGEKMKTINEFRKDYAFLSNFYECTVLYEGLCYRNAEAAFQAAKNIATDEDINEYLAKYEIDRSNMSEEFFHSIRMVLTNQKRFPYAKLTVSEAKKNGRHCKLRSDWENSKIRIMEEIIWNKFSLNEDLKQKLLETDGCNLIEGNTWNDRFWGVCKGKRENHLGKILESTRNKLKATL